MPKNSGKPWSSKDVHAIGSKAHRGETTKNIAKDLGRSEAAVYTKASVENITLKPVDKKGSDK